ncbi:C1 peptidase-like protein [Aureococcus anophagefferens]|nr:C1 peptidase-like protein [Aureococcus anophagefferens]
MLLKSLLLASTAAASEPAFRAWMAAHGRTYEGAAEFEARLAVFVENTAAIAALNDDPEDGATYAMNAFGDLSADEFRAQRLMGEGRAPPDLAAAPRLAVPAGDAPDAVDWRDEGAVTAVRDQGSLGTCWIFSTVQNLEGQAAIKSGENATDLSVEQILECDKNSNATADQADCGEFGGWPYLAFEYLMDAGARGVRRSLVFGRASSPSAGGLRSEADMPYCSVIDYGKPGYCLPCMVDGYSVKICGDHTNDDAGIPLYCEANTTLGQGPKGYCESRRLRQAPPYKKGVYSPMLCSKDKLDHAVLAVGYGTDGGKDYWTVKNSWGAKWGETPHQARRRHLRHQHARHDGRPRSMAVSHTIAALVLAAAATAWAPPRAARTRILRLYAEGVPAALEGDIRAYLAERERVIASGEVVDPAAAAREAATSNPVWRAGNAMLSLESLLPKESEDDESGDALSYTELQKFGYGSLIEPIMDCGGYVAVSRSLGVAYSLPKKPKEQSDDYVRDGPQRSLRRLQGGQARAIAALNATQIKLDRAAKEARRAERGAAPSAGALRLEQAMRERRAPAAPAR